MDIEIKEDNSPVTNADKGADVEIREYLSKLYPDYGFLTEESTDTEERFSKEFVFIIDPVDGTTEFISKNDQFATNIALAKNGVVVAGVVNIPAKGLCYGASIGDGAFRIEKDGSRTPIHVNDKTNDLLVLTSISHATEAEKALVKKHSDVISREEPCGAAWKFCRIAEGSAEISYRCSPYTKEWDVAAGDIILSEAGGMMLKPDKTRITYNKKDVYNRDGYILINKIENFLL